MDHNCIEPRVGLNGGLSPAPIGAAARARVLAPSQFGRGLRHGIHLHHTAARIHKIGRIVSQRRGDIGQRLVPAHTAAALDQVAQHRGQTWRGNLLISVADNPVVH
ncbi:hypothetical protein D3C71_1492460 [compost metagenome]